MYKGLLKYPKVVLTADRTLMSPYRGISLASFFGCAPAIDPNRSHDTLLYKILRNQVTPRLLFDFICNPISHSYWHCRLCPIWAEEGRSLFGKGWLRREDVVVAHPDYMEKFIGPETEVVGTYEMDPLGMGPVTMTFTYGRKQNVI